MAYDSQTLEILHGLTPEGEEHYQKMLEEKADEILFRHEHPFRWLGRKLSDMFS